MTSYPGQPAPKEPANVTFYIKDRNTGSPYAGPVSVRILKTEAFGMHSQTVPPTTVQPFDALHKLSVTFPDDGRFVVELTMDVEGQAEVIPFLMIAGQPSSPVSGLIVVGTCAVLFLVVVRAVRIKRRRRAAAPAAAAA